MNDFQLFFWNLGEKLKTEDLKFGCSVHGFAFDDKWLDSTDKQEISWDHKLQGKVISGSFKSVSKSLQHLNFKPVLNIVLFNKSTGIENFIVHYEQILQGIPIIGGCASISSGHISGELMPESDDLVLLAIATGSFDIQTANIYDDAGIFLEIQTNSPREFNKIRQIPDGEWLNAIDFIHEQQIKFGIDEGYFEHFTFSDQQNRNIHCHIEDGKLLSGANLPDNNLLHLMSITSAEAEKRLTKFISDDNSIIFGCAGIRSILKNSVFTGKNSLLVFMFGELVTLNQQPMFGNLMLTKLTLKN